MIALLVKGHYRDGGIEGLFEGCETSVSGYDKGVR
jgi:hypothetical protein